MACRGISISVKCCKVSDPRGLFVQTEDLIKALQDLENAASGDATVRQKIASLPQEVQDVSLLEKITGEALSRQHLSAWNIAIVLLRLGCGLQMSLASGLLFFPLGLPQCKLEATGP